MVSITITQLITQPHLTTMYQLNPKHLCTILIIQVPAHKVNFHHSTGLPTPILILLLARTILSLTFSQKKSFFRVYSNRII